MKITKLLYAFLLFTFASQNLQSQEDVVTKIIQGSTHDFSLTISGDNLIVKTYPSDGTVVLTNTGDLYSGTYTPDPDFLGLDYILLQEFTYPATSKDYPIKIEVVPSIVETNDDFIRLTSDQPVTIDPTSNDESSASVLDLSIVHVMFGTAIINSDNTITYTPGDSDVDYIVYSGKDMYSESSVSTIYITTEEDQPTGNSTDDFDVPSGNEHYIVLDWSDYELDGAVLEFGEIEQVNDYVWKYTANEGAGGLDQLVFTNEAGLSHTIDANVIEKYVDDGFVKDDIFFSAKNTELTFNVKDNDINSNTVIIEKSDELFTIGDGEFSFTPEPGSTGVYEFYYIASTGSEEEEGSIKIVVGNLNPTSSADYTLSIPKNHPRVIEYDVPLGTEYFEIESYPAHGTIEVFGSDESVDVGCVEGIQKVFALYTPNDNFVGADDVILRYYASGNNLPTYNTIVIITEDTDVEDECVCVDECVWPGDANGDGNVNIRDVLTIGRYIGESGEIREVSPYGDTYEGVSVPNWTGEQINGKSIGFADANGDGIISVDDINEVEANYDKVNTLVSSDLFGVKNIPFNLINGPDAEVGEVKEIYISAGSEAYPAIDMRGIAFSVNLPADNVDVSSIKVDFYEDNYFVKGAPYLSMTHVDENAIVEAAGIKTNGVSSTGSGIIGVVTFIVIESAEGIRPSSRNSSQGAKTVTVELSDIVFEAGDGLQYSIPGSSIDFEIKKDDEMTPKAFNVFPNPVMSNTTIVSKTSSNIQDIQILSMTGELLATYRNVNQVSKSIDMSKFDNGLYILNITSDQGVESMKLIKG